jgi:predicted O-methyltransferase YrrM
MSSIKKQLKRIPLVRRLHKIRTERRARAQARAGDRAWAPPFSEEEMAAAEQLALPADPAFAKTVQAIEQIEGMFSPFSMAAMDMLLAFQRSLGARGDILEIGTYHGKSAALLGTHLRAGERLVLVDIFDQLEPHAIAPFKDSTDFIVTASSKLKTALPNYSARRGSFRFIHIDASHGYDETIEELSMADELLGPGGIIAMDDFTNLDYSQNIAAIFRYLYTAHTDLVMLMVTDEKAYLCRQKDYRGLAEQIFKRAFAEMKSRGIAAGLARTSQSKDYRAFYLRHRDPSDEAVFFGARIYKNQILGIC